MLKRALLGYLPVNIVQALAGFGSIVLFTRLLSPSDYGVYALTFSVTSLVQTCLFVWIEASMARFYAAEGDEEGRHDLFATLYRTYAIMALALPLVGGVVIALLPLPGVLKLSVGVGLCSVLTRSLLKLAQERRRAAGEVRGFAVYDMLQTGGGFVIGGILALIGFGGAAPLAGIGVASAGLLVFALPSEIAPARAGRFDEKRLRTYLAYGVPLSLSLVMSLVIATTDRFVLAAFLNDAAVGAYHAGYSLSSRTLDVMFIWLGMAGAPACIMALERGGLEALNVTARAQADLMLLIAVPAAIGVALVSQPLAHLMVGQTLAERAAHVTPWIAIGALCSGLTTYYFHTAFTLARRTRRLLLAIAIPAALNVALTLLLIPRYGLDGALWSTVVSYAAGMVVSWALGLGVMPLPIPWTTFGKVAASAAVMAAGVLLLPSPGGLMEVLLKAAMGAAVYAVGVIALDAAGARGRLGDALRILRARGLNLGPAA